MATHAVRGGEWRALTSLWDPPPLPSSNPTPLHPPGPFLKSSEHCRDMRPYCIYSSSSSEEEKKKKKQSLHSCCLKSYERWYSQNVTHTGKLQLVVRHVEMLFFSLLLYSKVRKLFLSKYNLVLLNFYGPMKHRGERTKPTWKYNVKFKTGNTTGGEERLLNMNQITHPTEAHRCHNRKKKRISITLQHEKFSVVKMCFQMCHIMTNIFTLFFFFFKKAYYALTRNFFQDHTRLLFFSN